MAPTRKSLGFLTLRKTSLNRVKLKDVSFVHNSSDFSAKVNRRQSMRHLKTSTNRHVGTNYVFQTLLNTSLWPTASANSNKIQLSLFFFFFLSENKTYQTISIQRGYDYSQYATILKFHSQCLWVCACAIYVHQLKFTVYNGKDLTRMSELHH